MFAAKRAIGYRYGHHVLLRRAAGGVLTRFAAKIEVGPPTVITGIIRW